MGSLIFTFVILVVCYLHLGTTEVLGCRENPVTAIEAGESITIVSPNYPNPIPGDCYARWVFNSRPDNSIINLHCSEFDIPGLTPTCIDTFSFHPQSVESDVMYCGIRNMNFNSTKNNLIFYLHSISDNVVHPGLISYHSKRRFNCTVTALEPKVTTSGCGKNHLHSRVVGGEEAQVHEWPWMVALMETSTREQFCGGSLISPNWVLTAAHCVNKGTEDYMYVSIGEHELYSGNDTLLTMHFNVSQIIQHEIYSGPPLYLYDIAVIKLKDPVEYSFAISPVCLPIHQTAMSFANEKVTTTGWGQTSKEGPTSDDLLEVDLHVLSNDECTLLAYINEYHDISDRPMDRPILDNQVCANDEGKSSCHADSGGPLVWLDENDHYQLIGIVSQGLNDSACAHTNTATVYTRVTSFLDWIDEKTKIISCSN